MNAHESMFDPNQFLNSTTTEAAKRRPPISAGSDYTGTLGELKFRNQQGVKDPSKSYILFDIPIDVDLTPNPKERERVGQDTVRLTYSGFADFTPTGIDWSPGKNSGLRALREATGENVQGKAFSPSMLTGRMVRVRIVHDEYPEGSGELRDKIAGVAKP